MYHIYENIVVINRIMCFKGRICFEEQMFEEC